MFTIFFNSDFLAKECHGIRETLNRVSIDQLPFCFLITLVFSKFKMTKNAAMFSRSNNWSLAQRQVLLCAKQFLINLTVL